MRQKLIISLIEETQKVDPMIDSHELDKRFTEILNSYHVEHTGTEVAVYEPFPRAAQDFLTTRAIDGLAKSTLNMYKKILVRFFNEVNLPFSSIDATAIKVWIYSLQKAGLKDTTVKLYTGIVKTFFEWARNNDYLSSDPGKKVNTPKAEIHLKQPLTNVELTAVRDACKDMRERVTIELLYSTGCRIGELLTTKVSDINLRENTISMRNWKSRKDKTGFITPSLSYWLEKWIPQCSSDVLIPSRKHGTQLTISGFERMLAGIGKRAGLKAKLTPHILRHTLATDILNRGGTITDVQAILGHAKPETSLRYAKLSEDLLQSVHDRCTI